MTAVEQELKKRLKQMRVRVDVPDDDTVLLRNVPANARFFNKPRTNVLIKRPRQGMPCLICVDEDLEYTGDDSELARAFVAAHKQQGWRVLFVGHGAGKDPQGMIGEALNLLGFEDREPEMAKNPATARCARGSLLASFATELTTGFAGEPTIGRESEIEEVVSSLLQWQVRMPLVVGDSGVGKSNLVRAAARRLSRLRPSFKAVSIELSALMAGTLFDSEREGLLTELLKDITSDPELIVVFEHLETALLGAPRAHLLFGQALDQGARLIATALPCYRSSLEIEPLARRMQITVLAEMGVGETGEVLLALRDRISGHYQIQISATLLESVVESALRIEGRLPAKAISLLDAAAARAALAGEGELSLFDIYSAAGAHGGE